MGQLAANESSGRRSRHEGGGDSRAFTDKMLAALLYLGASFAAAVIFWFVTTFTGSYSATARYGGAAWVFLLTLIVVMPVVIPRIGRRARVDMRGQRKNLSHE